jgi:hypothetical protein
MASNDPTTRTALNVIIGALRKTGQYAPGETLSAADQTDALDVFNGLLDSLSNDNKAIFFSNENIVTLTANQLSYTVGNEYAGTFVGTVTSGSPTITGFTPPQVGTNGSAQQPFIVGATLKGPGIPNGTTATAIGSTTVTMSANAVGTFTNQISFTAPGQIVVQRPMRITQAYSRITTSSSTVDFPCEIKDIAAYASIGLKNQPGPWAKWLFYNPTWPNATIYFWPVPTQTVQFHFWTDMLLQSVSLDTVLQLPQGYYNYLQFALAELLCIDYGNPVPADIIRLARRYEAAIKSNNSTVDREIAIDAAIQTRNANNAGFILTGGF